MRWLDYFPFVPLSIAALALAFAPPFAQPHLWRQLKLLIAGDLHRMVDVVDLVIHASLLFVLALKVIRMRQLGRFTLD